MPLSPARHGGLRPGREGQRAAGPAAPLFPGAQVARRGADGGPVTGRGVPGEGGGWCLSWGAGGGLGTAPSAPRRGAPQDTSLEAERVCAGRGEPRLLVRSAPQWHRRELAGRPASTWVRLALDAQARGGVIPPSHPLPRVRPQGDK